MNCCGIAAPGIGGTTLARVTRTPGSSAQTSPRTWAISVFNKIGWTEYVANHLADAVSSAAKNCSGVGDSGQDGTSLGITTQGCLRFVQMWAAGESV